VSLRKAFCKAFYWRCPYERLFVKRFTSLRNCFLEVKQNLMQILCFIIIARYCYGGWDGRGVWHAWRRKEIQCSVGKPRTKRAVARRRCRWEGCMNMDLKEVMWECVDWVNVAQVASCCEQAWRLCVMCPVSETTFTKVTWCVLSVRRRSRKSRDVSCQLDDVHESHVMCPVS
jgi:hypothetical protein